MNSETTLILTRLAGSRAAPKITLEHLKALLDDARLLGTSKFLAAAQEYFQKSSSKREIHPLANMFLSAQDRTGRTRAEFIDLVIAEAKKQFGDKCDVPKSARSMPKVLDRLSRVLTEPQVQELLRRTGEKFSRTR